MKIEAGEKKQLVFLREGDWQEDLEVELVGAGARVKITHILLGKEEERSEIGVKVWHKAPNTESEVIVRAVVGDSSQIRYRGLIDIDESARGSRGFQSGKSLLLNSGAVSDMLPELAIRTNDVRCSHGVTTTHLDELALFYMKSRGLDEYGARQLAIMGFVNQGIDLPGEMRQRLNELYETTSPVSLHETPSPILEEGNI